MKFGAHAYLWRGLWTDDCLDLLENAKGLGLDFVEIATGDDVKFDARRTGRRARELGLELVVGPGGLWPMECDLSRVEAGERKRGLEWHCRTVDVAAELGAIVYAGALYGHPGYVEKRLPTLDDFKRTAEPLHALAEYAAARKVRIVLEPMSHFRTYLINRPEQVLQLIDLADHANLSMLLDTYHMVTEVRDYGAAIRAAAKRLWGFHACESDRGVPGGGLVPWAEVGAALREIKFDGYLGLESYNSGPDGLAASRGLFNDPCPDGDAFVKSGLAFLRGLVG
jgi:D-psicose/D-tagatose/L-ribulose 3-epimerase